MHFDGEFHVPGKAADVIRRFADVPRMAGCMPGAVLEPQAEDGSWPGKMVVAFGPKKINFKGRVTCEFDFAAHTGALHGRGSADMRAARIGVKVAFALRDAADAPEPTTIVKITSDAELGGVLADFARTGGVAVANVIMQDFARRAAAEFARDAPAPAEPVAAATPATPSSAAAASPSATAPPPPITNGGTPPAVHPAGGTATQDVSAAPSHAGAARQASPRLPPSAPAALSAHGVLWAVIRLKLRHLAQWLGLLRKDA